MNRPKKSGTPSYRIGTSGWHYAHWKGPFYPRDLPASHWLGYYSKRLGTLEINSSFYRLPSDAAVRQWLAETPEEFVFSVKGSRYITHMKKLGEPDKTLPQFLSVVDSLGKKCGPVLFQLPPRFGCNPGRLEHFLDVLPAGIRCAFEFRDQSWHRPDIYELLQYHGAAFCIYDLAGFQSPVVLTAEFAYLRLHGPMQAAYAGCYTQKGLQLWAERIRSWKGLKEIYVYFDNDQAGYAARNALELGEMLS